jgi:hypothetical protein
LPQLPNPNEDEVKYDQPKPKVIRRKRHPKKPKIEDCETPVEEPKDEDPQNTELLVDLELSTIKLEKDEIEEDDGLSDIDASGSEDGILSMEEEDEKDTERRAQLYSRISQRFKKQAYDPEEYEVPARKEEKKQDSLYTSSESIGHDRVMRPKVKVQHQYFENIRSLSNKVPHKGLKHSVYRRTTPPKGWTTYADGLKYLPKLHWSESLHERLPTWFPGQVEETQDQTAELYIHQDSTGSVGLFTMTEIPTGACLGEFTGEGKTFDTSV